MIRDLPFIERQGQWNDKIFSKGKSFRLASEHYEAVDFKNGV